MSSSSQPTASSDYIDDWRAKAFSISEDTQLRNVLTRTFEALKSIGTNNVKDLEYLQFTMGAQRESAFQYDTGLNENPLRLFFYGLNEAIERTIKTALMREREQTETPVQVAQGEQEVVSSSTRTVQPTVQPEGRGIIKSVSKTEETRNANVVTTVNPVVTPPPMVKNVVSDVHPASPSLSITPRTSNGLGVKDGSGVNKRESGRWAHQGDINRKTLNCLICTAKDFSLSTFVSHLTKVHGTTPFNANVVFKCECGYVATNAQQARIHRDSASHPVIFTVIERSTEHEAKKEE